MKNLAALLLAALTSGCATIMNGDMQDVEIGTSPSGAYCKIGGAASDITPIVASLKRAASSTVWCQLPGYEPVSAPLTSHKSGWLWGDLILGGPIGLAIDFADGAAYKLTPDNLQLTLFPKAKSGTPALARSAKNHPMLNDPYADNRGSLRKQFVNMKKGTPIGLVLVHDQPIEGVFTAYYDATETVSARSADGVFSGNYYTLSEIKSVRILTQVPAAGGSKDAAPESAIDRLSHFFHGLKSGASIHLTLKDGKDFPGRFSYILDPYVIVKPPHGGVFSGTRFHLEDIKSAESADQAPPGKAQ
jgi:hypothetical protein